MFVFPRTCRKVSQLELVQQTSAHEFHFTRIPALLLAVLYFTLCSAMISLFPLTRWLPWVIGYYDNWGQAASDVVRTRFLLVGTPGHERFYTYHSFPVFCSDCALSTTSLSLHAVFNRMSQQASETTLWSDSSFDWEARRDPIVCVLNNPFQNKSIKSNQGGRNYFLLHCNVAKWANTTKLWQCSFRHPCGSPTHPVSSPYQSPRF